MAKRISEDAVAKATGKGWAEWFSLLDASPARADGHKALARWVAESQPDISGWWAQMVTVSWEQERGKRALHQQADGFSASVSRTMPASAERVFEAWTDASARADWFPDHPWELRRATAPKSVRLDWEGGGRIAVWISAVDESKSKVAVQHEKLGSEEAVATSKALWAEALDRLKESLSTPRG